TISSVAIANTNYALEGWYDGDVKLVTGDDITVSGDTLNVTLTETTKDKTYTAKFQLATYKVTFASENATMGTVNPSGERDGIAGKTISSVAKAETNYALEGWYDEVGKLVTGGDITVSGDTLNVTLTETTKDKTYTAKFKLATYKVTFVSENATMGMVNPSGDQSGDAGSRITSVATANTNYALEGWYDGDVKIVTGDDIFVVGDVLFVTLTKATKDRTYTAKFEPVYTAMFVSEDLNKGTVNFPVISGISGTVAESTATAKSGYEFFGWFKGSECVGEKATLSRTLSASETGNTYTAEFETAGPKPSFSFVITTSAKVEYSLPFVANGTTGRYILTVDWGDGTELESILPGTSLGGGIKHIYELAGEHTITIASSKRALDEVQMPEVSWRDDKLLKKINSPLLNTGTTSFKDVFRGCFSLTTVPADLFSNNENATNFSQVFYGCSQLGSIPDALFSKNENATNFMGVFRGCSSLTTVSPDLFSNNKKATDFSQVFYGCSQLGSIPDALFKNNIEADNFKEAFYECSQIISIPVGLFGENRKATNFSRVFYDCSKLGSIPDALFKNNIAATNFEGVFYKCSQIGSIPPVLFASNIAATNFKGAFFGCSQISSIPDVLFASNIAATNLRDVFHSCSQITSIPSGLFANNVEVTSFGGVFKGCSQITSIPSGLFNNNQKATDLSNMFCDCTSLSSIPSDLFNNNIAATYFNGLFMGCTSLTAIPYNLFEKNIEVTNFSDAFKECTSLREIPANLFKQNVKAVDFERVFEFCYRAKVNPNIFCNDADETEKANRFKSLTGKISFIEAFYEVGRDLGTSDLSGSTFPALWNYGYSPAGVYSSQCFKNAKASNSVAVVDGWK
ncbi:MAG: InlB B-repeat-containing protein, partial [Phocaeicola sp.]